MIDGVGSVLGFVPLIFFMFLAIAIMEDSGYLARVAYMLDRVLRWFGLHGNSVLPFLISGGIAGGCAVPGVMATRTLRDPKERIATVLVVPFMNCGAKLPVFAMLIAAFFGKKEATMMFVFTILSWSFALFSAKFIRSTVLRGPKTPFVMELPPYRVPTLRGLLIHTVERAWQYIKKAGTIILGISILLWAMMTFPGLPEEKIRSYEEQRAELKTSFLALPEVKGLIKDGQGLEDFKNHVSSYERSHPDAVSAYLVYKEKKAQIDGRQNQEALSVTLAGRIGQILEPITRPIGFDYRTNIALVGGFAAKEVIVSTLGTAYSLSEVDSEQSTALSEKLRKDPNWNPLVGFTLVLFSMLYVPCFVTLISIRRESSWRWAGFSVAFNLIAAYLVSLVVYQVGSVLGVGT
jgi:ferrous iron transport protein B